MSIAPSINDVHSKWKINNQCVCTGCSGVHITLLRQLIQTRTTYFCCFVQFLYTNCSNTRKKNKCCTIFRHLLSNSWFFFRVIDEIEIKVSFMEFYLYQLYLQQYPQLQWNHFQCSLHYLPLEGPMSHPCTSSLHFCLIISIFECLSSKVNILI